MKALPETVNRHIVDGVRTIDVIASLSGYSNSEIRALAQQQGYVCHQVTGKFMPAKPVTLAAPQTDTGASTPEAKQGEASTGPTAAPVWPIVRDLIAEGEASSVDRIRRAAARARTAVDDLAALLDRARIDAERKAKAEAEKVAAAKRVAATSRSSSQPR